MTVLLLSTHIHWWLFYFSQLTCIARWPACRPSPCVTSAGWSASGSSPTCCPPPPLSIRHSAARAPHETCPKWLGTFTILIRFQATQAHVQSIYLPLHWTLSSIAFTHLTYLFKCTLLLASKTNKQKNLSVRHVLFFFNVCRCCCGFKKNWDIQDYFLAAEHEHPDTWAELTTTTTTKLLVQRKCRYIGLI